MLTALASASTLDHPLLNEREDPKRAGILLITSDRGLCGGYNANAIKAAEELGALLRVAGQGAGDVRHRPQGRWLLHVPADADRSSPGPASRSGRPTPTPSGRPRRCCRRSSPAPPATTEDGEPGIDEMHLVSTHFVSMITQRPQARRMAPMEVEYVEHDPTQGTSCCRRTSSSRRRMLLLDEMLPKYVKTRIYAALLDSAAPASRPPAGRPARRRPTTPTTSSEAQPEANQARQAQITQELTEIVGGADALAAAGNEED